MKRLIPLVLAFILVLSVGTAPLSFAAAASRPAKVAGLQITTAGKQKRLKLTWNRQAQADGYQVYRSATGKTGSYQKVATLRNKTTFVDKNLKAAKTYYYAVRAFQKENGKNVYGKFTKINLSTRLTKTAIQRKMVSANRFYIGWMLHCFEAWDCMDETDTRPIPGEEGNWTHYVRIKSDKYKSVADLRKEAAKHFTKAFYQDFIDRMYADIDGKLYIKAYDQGGDGGSEFDALNVLSLTDTACHFSVVSHGSGGDQTYTFSDDYHMVYQNGRWLFRNMTDDFGIYFNGNDYWKKG